MVATSVDGSTIGEQSSYHYHLGLAIVQPIHLEVFGLQDGGIGDSNQRLEQLNRQ